MDDPEIDGADLDHAMAHLEFVNRSLNGYGPSIAGIKALVPPGVKELSLLDIGCGSGDTLRKVALWARKRDLKIMLHGIELSDKIAARAKQCCADFPEITINQADFFEMDPDAPYDIVHCALVLHHISDEDDVVRFLKKMGQMARRGVVVNDLHRHPLAYHSIRILTKTLSRSRVLQNDAPLSVARGFSRRDLEEAAAAAGLTDVKVEWHWAFRWLLTAGAVHDSR